MFTGQETHFMKDGKKTPVYNPSDTAVGTNLATSWMKAFRATQEANRGRPQAGSYTINPTSMSGGQKFNAQNIIFTTGAGANQVLQTSAMAKATNAAPQVVVVPTGGKQNPGIVHVPVSATPAQNPEGQALAGMIYV